LLLVVTLILIGGRLLKKHPSLAKRGLPPAALEVLGRQVVDQRQSILIVRLGSRLLVLGANAGGMRTLAEITDPVEVDYLAGLCRTPETDATVAQTFRALFHRHVPEDATPTEDAASSIYPPEGRADSLAQSSEEPDLTPRAWEQSHA
jgi:flagellar biogenesis protein FliO